MRQMLLAILTWSFCIGISSAQEIINGTVRDEDLNFTTNSVADFTYQQFEGMMDFTGQHFQGGAVFNSCHFDGFTNFKDVRFDSKASFKHSNFNGIVSFDNAVFNDILDFSYTNFSEEVRFRRAVMPEAVVFSGSSFDVEIDFRLTNLDMMESIYLEEMHYKIGHLWVYWEQLERRGGKYRIQLQNAKVLDPDDRVLRLQRIYQDLSNNYKAQDNLKDSDNAMYELALRIDDIEGGIWDTIYCLLLGYGYKPLRFLGFVIFVLAFFTFIFYRRYYGMVVLVVNERLYKDLSATVAKAKINPHKFNFLRKFDHQDFAKHNNISWLYRIWHTLLFCASVMFGIRYKKEWSDISPQHISLNQGYLKWTTSLYIIGLLQYVFFGVFVKTSGFQLLKTLFGGF